MVMLAHIANDSRLQPPVGVWGSVSVPVRRVTLSGPLPIVALVSSYLTNKLMGPGPVTERNHLYPPDHGSKGTIGYYPPFPVAIPDSEVGYPGITLPFAARVLPKEPFRSTCMSKPRRQRSF